MSCYCIRPRLHYLQGLAAARVGVGTRNGLTGIGRGDGNRIGGLSVGTRRRDAVIATEHRAIVTQGARCHRFGRQRRRFTGKYRDERTVSIGRSGRSE